MRLNPMMMMMMTTSDEERCLFFFPPFFPRRCLCGGRTYRVCVCGNRWEYNDCLSFTVSIDYSSSTWAGIEQGMAQRERITFKRWWWWSPNFILWHDPTPPSYKKSSGGVLRYTLVFILIEISGMSEFSFCFGKKGVFNKLLAVG